MSEVDVDAGFELTGTSTPPMANGEVVFDAPWQGRVFGMARALAEQGVFSWDEFRDCLIEQLDGVTTTGEAFRYFDYFLLALEQQVMASKLLGQQEVEALIEVLKARPHGHDHSH